MTILLTLSFKWSTYNVIWCLFYFVEIVIFYLFLVTASAAHPECVKEMILLFSYSNKIYLT